jgi:hypothetical protein
MIRSGPDGGGFFQMFWTANNVDSYHVDTILVQCDGLLPVTSLSYQTNPAIYENSTTIANNIPLYVGNRANQFLVSPTLPAGLFLDVHFGILSGTPNGVFAQAVYTVTASNPAGSTTVDLSITVLHVPPTNLVYAFNDQVYPNRAPITPNTPSHTGGEIVLYTISPALPLGLNFDPATGVISGTPLQASYDENYVVTATNTGGSTTFDLRFLVPSTVTTTLTSTITTTLTTSTIPTCTNANGALLGTIQFSSSVSSDPVEIAKVLVQWDVQDLAVPEVNRFVLDAGQGILITCIQAIATVDSITVAVYAEAQSATSPPYDNYVNTVTYFKSNINTFTLAFASGPTLTAASFLSEFSSPTTTLTSTQTSTSTTTLTTSTVYPCTKQNGAFLGTVVFNSPSDTVFEFEKVVVTWDVQDLAEPEAARVVALAGTNVFSTCVQTILSSNGIELLLYAQAQSATSAPYENYTQTVDFLVTNIAVFTLTLNSPTGTLQADLFIPGFTSITTTATSTMTSTSTTTISTTSTTTESTTSTTTVTSTPSTTLTSTTLYSGYCEIGSTIRIDVGCRFCNKGDGVEDELESCTAGTTGN